MWMMVGSEGLYYFLRSNFSLKPARAEALAHFNFNADALLSSGSHFGYT